MLLIASNFVASLAGPSLAQTGRKLISPDEQREIYVWLTIIVVISLILGVAGYYFWRRFKKLDETDKDELPSFSLASMRRLYEDGEISHEEFMNIKTKLIGEARQQMLGEPDIVETVETKMEVTATDAGTNDAGNETAGDEETPADTETRPDASSSPEVESNVAEDSDEDGEGRAEESDTSKVDEEDEDRRGG